MGPENSEEKNGNLWKKLVGGYQITPGTNFRHTFRKNLPDPPGFIGFMSFVDLMGSLPELIDLAKFIPTPWCHLKSLVLMINSLISGEGFADYCK